MILSVEALLPYTVSDLAHSGAVGALARGLVADAPGPTECASLGFYQPPISVALLLSDVRGARRLPILSASPPSPLTFFGTNTTTSPQRMADGKYCYHNTE